VKFVLLTHRWSLDIISALIMIFRKITASGPVSHHQITIIK